MAHTSTFDQSPFFTFGILGCSLIFCKYCRPFQLNRVDMNNFLLSVFESKQLKATDILQTSLLYFWSSFVLKQPGVTMIHHIPIFFSAVLFI